MFVKLYATILDSSIWFEPPHVLKTFLAMLLLCDAHGVVRMPIPALARRIDATVDDVEAALQILESPDTNSRTPDEEGRRLIRDGSAPVWQIVNYTRYRDTRDADSRREYQKQWAREKRAALSGRAAPVAFTENVLSTPVDTPSTAADSRRQQSTKEEVEVEEEVEVDKKEEGVPARQLASLAHARNSPFQAMSDERSPFDPLGPAEASSVSMSSSEHTSSVAKRSRRAKTARVKSTHFEEGDPALVLADHFIALMSGAEPLLVLPNRQKWALDCQRVMQKAADGGIDSETLKAVITDAITHDGTGAAGTRYYTSPAAFLGEWKNGTDKLNAALLNWRSRQRPAKRESLTTTRKDYDASSRNKPWFTSQQKGHEEAQS